MIKEETENSSTALQLVDHTLTEACEWVSCESPPRVWMWSACSEKLPELRILCITFRCWLLVLRHVIACTVGLSIALHLYVISMASARVMAMWTTVGLEIFTVMNIFSLSGSIHKIKFLNSHSIAVHVSNDFPNHYYIFFVTILITNNWW